MEIQRSEAEQRRMRATRDLSYSIQELINNATETHDFKDWELRWALAAACFSLFETPDDLGQFARHLELVKELNDEEKELN